jgi:hypothetical protein
MITREQVYMSRHLAGRVKRYHTWMMLNEQTVAEHCWNVASIFVEIFGMPSAEVLYFCLHHDSGELWAGDLPFGIKQKTNGLGEKMKEVEAIGLQMLEIKLPELTSIEYIQVKICDLLEMNETGRLELNLGNSYAEPIIRDTLKAAQGLAAEHGLSTLVNNWLLKNGGRV